MTLHQTFKPMANIKLSLAQMQTINGASMHQGAMNSLRVRNWAEHMLVVRASSSETIAP